MRIRLTVLRCVALLPGLLLAAPAGAAHAAPSTGTGTSTGTSTTAGTTTTAARADPLSSPPRMTGGRLDGPGLVAATATPPLPTVAAASWLVADLDTGEVLAAKDAHGRFAPASTLKTLTAVTLIPLLQPDRKLVPTFADVNVDGSRVGVVERVGYPVSELLRAMLMVSGNDAANVLATAAGGQAETARLMNAKAEELGALDTHAVNPHGLDAPGQVSSAYDLAVIGRAGLADPAFARDVATRSSSISAPGGARIQTHTHDKLLDSYPGALGVKNGYTVASRASYIGAAARDGHRIMVTLMRADPHVFAEATKLLDWGFAARAAGDLTPVGALPGVSAGAGDGAGTAQLAGAPSDRLLVTAGPPFAATRAAVPASDDLPLPGVLAGLALALAALLYARPMPAGPVAARRRRPRRSAQLDRPVLPAEPADSPRVAGHVVDPVSVLPRPRSLPGLPARTTPAAGTVRARPARNRATPALDGTGTRHATG